jgi:hypothetical protein
MRLMLSKPSGSLATVVNVWGEPMGVPGVEETSVVLHTD